MAQAMARPASRMIHEGPDEYFARRSAIARRRIHAPRVSIDLLQYEQELEVDYDVLLPHHCALNFKLDNRIHSRISFPDRGRGGRDVNVGALSFLPPNERTRFSGHGRVATLSCLFDWDLLRDDMDLGEQWTMQRLLAAIDIRDSQAQIVMRKLAGVVRADDFGSGLEAECFALLALTNSLRHVLRLTEPNASSGLAPWQLRAIENRILSFDLPAPSLSDLADLCHISRRHLTRGYRRSRGITIGEFIRSSHLQVAQELLLTDMTLDDISQRLGFRSACNFSTAFRRHSGLSPTQYRRHAGRRVYAAAADPEN